MRHRLASIARVERERDAAGGENAEIGGDEGGRDFRQHADHVARADAGGVQCCGHGVDAAAEFGPIHRLPDAAILLAQNRRRRLCRDLAGKQVRQGGVVHGQRHSFFFFQRRWPRSPASFWPR